MNTLNFNKVCRPQDDGNILKHETKKLKNAEALLLKNKLQSCNCKLQEGKIVDSKI